MEYIRCQQKVLPMRFAFAVSLSDTDGVLNAVRYSTALWGGLGNILVPIWKKFPSKKEKRRTLGLLKDFDPDFIVNLAPFSLPKEISDTYGKRTFPSGEFIKKNKDNTFRFGRGLSILPLFNYIWTTETRSISGKSRCLRFKDIKGRYKKYWTFVFGDYPENKGLDFGTHFSSTLKARELKATFANLEKVKLDEIISPIDFTVYALTRLGYGGGFSSHIVYIGNPSNTHDLVEYWNMRASGKEILFVPTTHYKKFGKQITSLIKAGDYPINERVQNQADMQKGPSVKEEQFEETCNWVRDELKLNPPRCSWLPNWGRRSKRVVEDIMPRKYVDTERTTNLMFDGENLAPLELTRPSFFEDDKLYQDFRRAYQDRIYWVNEIDLGDNYKNDYFFDLPYDLTLSNLVSHSFFFAARDKARITEKGVVYYNDAVMSEVNIHPLKTEDVVKEMFKKRGMEIEPSPPGIFAKRIIEYMGGLDSCRVFKLRGIRDVLVQLSKQKPRFGMTHGELKGIARKSQTDQFGGPNWDSSVYKDLVLYYKQPQPLTAEIAIDHLFKKNVFRAGLRFVCQNCGKEDWYHLTEFNVNFTCRYCFDNQHIGSLEGSNKKEWHYKSDGLFMIPNAGEGSLGVILALWRLHHLTHGNGFKYVTSQNIKGIKDGEVDFIAVMTNHFQMGSILVLGEARNFVDFTQKDVSKLIKIGSKFNPKPYLCFATLKDEFSDKEKEQLKRVIKHDFGLIPLTRRDLDPYGLYDRFDSLKDKYAVTLEGFSFNLCSLNLGLNEGKTYDLQDLRASGLNFDN
ncbi:hypothetical protein KKB40_05655 [Patescibacteria group bacterium]|nr:hypothetical protein [Patescibacteria group bacterium]